MEAPVMFSNRFWRNASGVLREGQSSTRPKATFAERFIRCLTSLQMWPPPSVSRTWQPNLSQNITTTFVSKITSRQVYFLLYLVFFFVACFYIREQRLGLEFPCLLNEQPLQFWENPTRACIYRLVIIKRLKFPIWMNYPFKRHPERCSADYMPAEYQSMTLCKPAGSHSVQRWQFIFRRSIGSAQD